MLFISGLSVVIILTIGAADSVGRAFLNKPVVGAVEISEALLAVTIFSALAFAQKQGSHVVVDIFSSNYGPRLTRFAKMAILVLTLAALGFLLWRMSITAYKGWLHNEISAGFLPVPVWLAKVFAALGLAVASIECIRELIWGIVEKNGRYDHSVQVIDNEKKPMDIK
tara:strand:+ start:5069 stop:5572 length:504 start_codon:yes stop_codon:yes gene_type:complete